MARWKFRKVVGHIGNALESFCEREKPSRFGDCGDGKAAKEAYMKDSISPLKDRCCPRNVVAGPD
jgi:hypothetical protein